jgi:Flp pilus assembly protein TadG
MLFGPPLISDSKLAARGLRVARSGRGAIAASYSALVNIIAETKGVSAVEFGLVTPILLGLLSPLIDIGLAYSQQIKLRHAAEAGAQYASLNTWSSSTVAAIQTATNSATPLSVTWAAPPTEFCGCPNGSNTQITNTGNPPCSGTPSGCSEPAGYYVTFTVTSNYTPVMPFSVLSNPTTLTAQPVVRVQ